MKQQQTIKYFFGSHDEDATSQAWKDWLSSLILFSNGVPCRESFVRTDQYIEMGFYRELETTLENFLFDPRDANMTQKEIRRGFIFNAEPLPDRPTI